MISRRQRSIKEGTRSEGEGNSRKLTVSEGLKGDHRNSADP